MRDRDLEWLLCEAPALFGEASGQGAIVAALERGPGGVANPEGAWDAIERARPHVARARRLRAAWGELAPDQRELLRLHYAGPACRIHGAPAQLGELARVAFFLASDRAALERACGHPSGAGNARRIAAAGALAARALGRAHQAWRNARQAAVLSSLGGG